MRSGRWHLPAARLLAEVQHLLVDHHHGLGVITVHYLEVEMNIENEVVIVIVDTNGIRRRVTSEFILLFWLIGMINDCL